MHVFLATQDLGTVTSLAFCKHINTIILSTLEINSTIIKFIVQCWLKYRLGYECKESKKGMYINEHTVSIQM